MRLASQSHVTCEPDLASFRCGCAVLRHFADHHPDALDVLSELVVTNRAFDAVQRLDHDEQTIIVMSKPSRALLRVIRSHGGSRFVNAVLHAFGFDPEVRAAA